MTKIMTSVRFDEKTRQMIDQLVAEENTSMGSVLESAVALYYEQSIHRLYGMIYELEGRLGYSTKLIDWLEDGDIESCRSFLVTTMVYKNITSEAYALCERVKNRIKLVEIAP